MDGKEPPLRSVRDVAKVWERFKSGDLVGCPKCDGSMALAVEGSSKSYRLVCTQCGTSTPWFEPSGADLILKFEADGSDLELPDDD